MTVAEIEFNIEVCKKEAAKRLSTLLGFNDSTSSVLVDEFISLVLTASILEITALNTRTMEAIKNDNLHST